MDKSTLEELFKHHNSIVKPAYIVEDINVFENYLFSQCEYDETLVDGVNYVEIASNETISGAPATLNFS